MESGTGVELWGYSDKTESRKRYLDTMNITKCPKSPTESALKCLQSLSAEEIGEIEIKYSVHI